MTTTPTSIEIFDTTLRDGLQVEGVTATVEDKLRIAEQLDVLGVQFIEGGWPGANPKDIEFFARAANELALTTSTLVAFGSTRRPRGKVDSDDTLRNLLDASTPAVCIVAKSSAYHVTEALQTTLDEGEAMIADSVRFLRDAGRLVLVDMEHFFDGFKADPEFSLRALEAAVVSGASHVVLCDTNGGSLPHEVEAATAAVVAHVGGDVTVGIHCHDDTGCAVANSMAAVAGGARHVQGTLTGIGERTGNANLSTIIGNLELKLGYSLPPRGPPDQADERQPPHRRAAQPGHQPAGALRRLRGVRPQGRSARQRHRPGQGRLRARRSRDGRQRHTLRGVGDGRAGDDHDEGRRARPADGRAGGQQRDRRPQAPRTRGLPLRSRRRVAGAADAPRRRLGAGLLQRREHACHHRRASRTRISGRRRRSRCGSASSATSRPPRATARSTPSTRRLRAALNGAYPALQRVHLTDFKVRILDGAGATGAVTRVLLDATDGEHDWTTIGVSANIIEASWRALEESIVYGLLHSTQ